MTELVVQRWDTCELGFRAAGVYENPFTEVQLSAVFRHEESGHQIKVDGFFDGADTWRLRFMPPEQGTWAFETHGNDAGLDGIAGAISCVLPEAPYLHGPLRARGHHLQHADGTRRYLISTRVSCQFSTPEVLENVAQFCAEHSINRVFFIMGGIHGTIGELYGEGRDFARYSVNRFQKIDAFVDVLRKHDIIASPYFYYYNDGAQRAMTLEQDRAYLRYGMARFGAYANVMPVLANQVEGKYTLQGPQSTAYDPRNHTWANEMGAYLKSKAVFGVPVTVHNPLENQKATCPSFYSLLRDWPFSWADLMLRQMQIGSLGSVSDFPDDVPEQEQAGAVAGRGMDGREIHLPLQYNPRAYHNQNLLLTELRRFGVPVVNEEPGYEMKGLEGNRHEFIPLNWNTQTSETLLATYWTGALAGAYPMWGSLETYSLVDPLPGMRNSATPGYLSVLHQVMAHLPYWQMAPCNEAVSAWPLEIEGREWRTIYCLAKEAEAYLVFSLYGGGGHTIHLPPGGQYRVTRVNPRSGDETELGQVDGGDQQFDLPFGEWVLLYRRV